MKNIFKKIRKRKLQKVNEKLSERDIPVNDIKKLIELKIRLERSFAK